MFFRRDERIIGIRTQGQGWDDTMTDATRLEDFYLDGKVFYNIILLAIRPSYVLTLTIPVHLLSPSLPQSLPPGIFIQFPLLGPRICTDQIASLGRWCADICKLTMDWLLPLKLQKWGCSELELSSEEGRAWRFAKLADIIQAACLVS